MLLSTGCAVSSNKLVTTCVPHSFTALQGDPKYALEETLHDHASDSTLYNCTAAYIAVKDNQSRTCIANLGPEPKCHHQPFSAASQPLLPSP